MIKSCWRVGLTAVLAVAAHSTAAHAQEDGHFTRVTTFVQSRARSSANVTRAARPARTSTAAMRLITENASLRPYSARMLAQSHPQDSQTPESSTWRQQPERPAPQPEAANPERYHNYYPGLRSGLAASQPVTLTAQPAFYFDPCCSPSRGAPLAAAGQHP
jgi:hypothetical protein